METVLSYEEAMGHLSG